MECPIYGTLVVKGCKSSASILLAVSRVFVVLIEKKDHFLWKPISSGYVIKKYIIYCKNLNKWVKQEGKKPDLATHSMIIGEMIVLPIEAKVCLAFIAIYKRFHCATGHFAAWVIFGLIVHGHMYITITPYKIWRWHITTSFRGWGLVQGWGSNNFFSQISWPADPKCPFAWLKKNPVIRDHLVKMIHTTYGFIVSSDHIGPIDIDVLMILLIVSSCWMPGNLLRYSWLPFRHDASILFDPSLWNLVGRAYNPYKRCNWNLIRPWSSPELSA